MMMEKCVFSFLDWLFAKAEQLAGPKPQATTTVSPEKKTIRFNHEDRMVEGDLFK